MAQPDLTEGQKYINDLRASGFKDEEINSDVSQQSQDMSKNGFNDKEIMEYWGRKQPDFSGIKDQVQNNIVNQAKTQSADQAAQGAKPPREPIDASVKPLEAHGLMELLATGWGGTGLGMAFDKAPNAFKLPEDASIAQASVAQGGALLGDLPLMTAGTILGGGPESPAGWAAGGALPGILRSWMMDKYRKGEVQDGGDFMRRVLDATLEGAKGAAINMATMGVGQNLKVINALGGPIAQKLTGTLPRLAAENAVMTTVSSAFDGKLPSMRDFATSGVTLLGLHAVSYGAGKGIALKDKLMNTYENTGATPDQVIDTALTDPALRGELASDNPDLPEFAEQKITVPPQPDLPMASADVPAEAEREIAPQKVNEGYELPEEHRQKVLSAISEEPEETKESLTTKAKKGAMDFYVNTFDKTERYKQFLDQIGNESVYEKKNAYVLMRAFGDINAKIEAVTDKQGTIDPKTNDITGEPLDKIFKDYTAETGDKSLTNLSSYMMSQHFLELQKRGITQGAIDAEAAGKIAEAGFDKYDKYAKRLVDFQNKNIDYAVGKGLLSEKMGEAFKKNKYYIPFHKIVEADSQGKAGSPNSFKAIGESFLKIKDPIQAIYRNTEVLIRMADINDIKRTAVQDLMTAESPEDFISPHQPDMRPIDVSGEEIAKALKSQGIDVDQTTLDGMKVFRQASYGARDDGVFMYRDNGEMKAVEVDPGLAEVMNSYSEMPQQMGMLTRMFRAFASTMRFGMIQNPLTGFFLRHQIRNQQQAAIFSKTGMMPFEGAFRAGLEAMGATDKDLELWDQGIRDGAFINSIDNSPYQYHTDVLGKMQEKMPFVNQAWNVIDDKVLGFSHAMIMANDNSLRFLEYKNTLDQGGSRYEATLNARDVLADFQKAGLQRSFLQATTAFFKAHYQGEIQTVEALTDPAQRWGVVARNIGYIMLPSVLLSLAQSGDERLKGLPDWLKFGYWNVHLPYWRDATQDEFESHKKAYPDEVRQKPDGSYSVNDGYVFKIPLPFTNGKFFANAAQETFNSLKDRDPERFGKLLANVAEDYLTTPIPTALSPVLEQMTNRNFFGHKPLVRAEMERNHVPEMQYAPYTSESAKLLAKGIAAVPLLRDIGPEDARLASPAIIENYVNQWTGGSGKYLLQLSDWTLRQTGVVNKNINKPETTWDEVPFFREFLVRNNIGSSQEVKDFLDSANLADRVTESIKQAAKEHDTEQVVRLQTRYQTDGYKLDGLREGIMKMTKAMTNIASDPDPKLTSVQKRQQIDGLTYQIIGLAKQGNQIVKDFNEDFKKRHK